MDNPNKLVVLFGMFLVNAALTYREIVTLHPIPKTPTFELRPVLQADALGISSSGTVVLTSGRTIVLF
jgi:hypothetical protein